MDDLLTDAVRPLLADQCTPAVVRAVESGDRGSALWQALEASGFMDALMPEAAGGAGLSLTQAYPVFELSGAHALPLPFGETLVARALIARAARKVPPGRITLARGTLELDGSVWSRPVSLGAVADWVLLQVDRVTHVGGSTGAGAALAGQAVLLPVAAAQAENTSFVLDRSLRWSAAHVAAATVVPGCATLRLWQAVVVAAQLAGALHTVYERTLQYANDRVQFGRPIGKFQAIQHQLSVMAEHSFAARAAAQLGCCALPDGNPHPQRAAAAKARASEAALEVASLAHAIHGAIGFTVEFDLNLYTRRLHAWRQLAGAESYWQQVLGAAVLQAPHRLSLDVLREMTDVA